MKKKTIKNNNKIKEKKREHSMCCGAFAFWAMSLSHLQTPSLRENRIA
jgi:hypothetical protein